MEIDFLMDQFQNLRTDNLGFSRNCHKLTIQVRSGKLQILQLIERLEPFLVNTLPSEREKGILILSLVLENLSEDFLNATQLKFICKFYSDKLTDHHQVIPAVLKGMIVLPKFKNIPNGGVTELLSSLFNNVSCQQQQQTDRYNIYLFLKIVLDSSKEEVTAMELDFVFGVISAMDSERDPKNLLLLFNWLPNFLKIVKLGHLLEEMFEVMACYFPVDFKAPHQDPKRISRDSLATALSSCLCGLPSFASYCIPLAIEKLNSDLRIAKLDSLDLLIYGCSAFADDIYIQYLTEIWSLLYKLISEDSDEEIQTKCLLTLTFVIKKLSFKNSESYKQIIKDITNIVKGNLRPESKEFYSSSRLLISVSKASKDAAIYINKEIIPFISDMYNIATSSAHQVILFKALIDFVQICTIEHGISIHDIQELKRIPNLCLEAIVHNESDIKATGFYGFSVIVDFIESDIRHLFYGFLVNLIVTPQSPVVRKSLLYCFKKFAIAYTSDILNLLININITSIESLRLYLEAISQIAPLEEYTEVCLRILVRFVFQDEASSAIALNVLTELCFDNCKIQLFLINEENIIDRLIDTSLKSHQIDGVASFLSLVIGKLTKDVQETLVNKQLEKVISFCGSWDNQVPVIILCGLLCNIRRNVEIKCNVFNILCETCLQTENLYTNEISAQLLGNMLNKMTDDINLQNNLKQVEGQCANILINFEENEHKLLCVVNVISFIAKGLVLRGHSLWYAWTDKLLELTEKHRLAAYGFRKLLCDNYDYFSSTSYCNRRLLFKQKIFAHVFTELQKYDREKNKNCLMVVGFLLQEIPKQVLKMELRKIVRLLILCLDQCEEPDILCPLLTILTYLIQDKEPIIEQYIQEFLNRFMRLTQFEKCMNVRILALQCIGYSTVYSLYKLLPLKNNAITTLGHNLDDPKRLVRREAMEARSKWFLIDTP